MSCACSGRMAINASPLLSSGSPKTRRSICPELSLETASAPGGSEEQLLTYDPARVVWPDHVLCAPRIADLSVLGDVWVYAYPTALVAVALGVSLGSEGLKLDDQWVRAADNASSALGTLVAFVIGSFLSTVVSTWNARRAQYAALAGASRDLLLQLGTVVAVEEGAQAEREAVAATREQLGRYVLLACELAHAKGRGTMDGEGTRAALQEQGLLRAGEWEAMAAGDRHTLVYGWIQGLAVRLARRGLLSQMELSLVANAVSRARAAAGDLMASLGSDLPYPYASLVALLVKFHMTAHALGRGFELPAYASRGAQAYVLLFLFLNLTFLQAIVHLHRLLHNPFAEGRRLGVAHRAVMSGLQAVRAAVTDGHALVPPPTGPVGAA